MCGLLQDEVEDFKKKFDHIKKNKMWSKFVKETFYYCSSAGLIRFIT